MDSTQGFDTLQLCQNQIKELVYDLAEYPEICRKLNHLYDHIGEFMVATWPDKASQIERIPNITDEVSSSSNLGGKQQSATARSGTTQPSGAAV